MIRLEDVKSLPDAPDFVLLWQEDDWPRFISVDGEVYEVGILDGRLVKRRRQDYEYRSGSGNATA
jgi:hypothetical protein